MRSLLAGLLLLLISTAFCFAQVSGFVESIGYQNSYRPVCWTPMLVNLTSQVSDPASYQLQVWQEDLDRDQVVYTKNITLSPHAQDKFQLYFVPQPSNGGIEVNPGEALHVRVCLPPKEGQRPEDAKMVIDRLPARIQVTNLDPERNVLAGNQRGSRVVLLISDSGEVPGGNEYQRAIGTMEDVAFIRVPIQELGENVLYYQAADAVLWLSGRAELLDQGGAKRLEALEEYVREGGKLVVCQPTERGQIAALAPLLPIELKDANDNWLIDLAEHKSFDPRLDALPQIARTREGRGSPDYWTNVKGPFNIAVPSKLRPGAIVEVWDHQNRDDADHIDPNRTPYIVRHPYGQGAVTWVAQDLGNRNLNAANSNGEARWPNVWDTIMGWRSDAHLDADVRPGDEFDKKYGKMSMPDQPVDLGRSLIRGMEFQGKGAAYIFVAILFFIIYWIAAGPGTYIYLGARKRRELNWLLFGLWAFAATAVTMVVVRLLLRGAPEVRHQTLVRTAPNEPAYIDSRIGLYIPQDGYQAVALGDNARDRASVISPFRIYPGYFSATDYPAAQDYAIPIHDDPQPVIVQIPYRSTLKKLQARWVGDLDTGVTGAAKLMPAKGRGGGYLGGTLTNQTGADLSSVFFVFNYPVGNGDDWALYISHWNKNASIDLTHEFDLARTLGMQGPPSDPSTQNRKAPLSVWQTQWFHEFPPAGYVQADNRGDDFDSGGPHKSFLIMSLFDRLSPDQTTHNTTNTIDHARIDFLRRGGHDMNVSPAIGAGQLVVLAEAQDRNRPLPFPLEVNGSKVAGEGTVLYQFILPLDRSQLMKAIEAAQKPSETQPSTQK